MLDNHWPQPVRHGSMRYPSGMRAAIIVLGLIATGARAQAPTADDLLRAAIAEQQQGDYQSAIRDYRKALQVRPDMMEAKVNLGAALSRTGQYDEAIAMYESALPSLSYKAPVLLNLGLAYYKKGDFPVTDRHAVSMISFPAHEHLTQDQLAYMVETVSKFYAA